MYHNIILVPCFNSRGNDDYLVGMLGPFLAWNLCWQTLWVCKTTTAIVLLQSKYISLLVMFKVNLHYPATKSMQGCKSCRVANGRTVSADLARAELSRAASPLSPAPSKFPWPILDGGNCQAGRGFMWRGCWSCSGPGRLPRNLEERWSRMADRGTRVARCERLRQIWKKRNPCWGKLQKNKQPSNLPPSRGVPSC